MAFSRCLRRSKRERHFGSGVKNKKKYSVMATKQTARDGV